MPLAPVRLPAVVLAAAVWLAPAETRAYCAEPFVREGVVQYLDLDTLRRFDLSSETWLAPIPVGFDARRVVLEGNELWIQTDDSMAAYSAAGPPRVEIVPAAGIASSAVRDGHVFLHVFENNVGHVLRSYDAATGEFESAVHLATDYQGLLAVPGRVYAWSYERIDAVSYDAEGRLGEPVSVHPRGLVQTYGLSLDPSGERIVGTGLVFDPATLAVIEGFEGAFPVFLGDRLVTLEDDSRGQWKLGLYDAARNLMGVRNVAVEFQRTYDGIFAGDEAVYGLRCGGPTPTFERVDIADFTPTQLQGARLAAGFERGEISLATSEEGIAYFIAANGEPHLRRWRPVEGRFLSTIPLRESPQYVTRAVGGGVFLTYTSGRVTRIEANGETEVPFATIPRSLTREVREPLHAPPWVVFTDGRRFHAYAADGAWRSGLLDESDGYGNEAVWDAGRNRLLWNAAESVGGTHTVTIDGGGTLVPGPDTPLRLSGPFAASSADRLLSRNLVLDLDTLVPLATLPLLTGIPPYALWHTNDRLVTLSGHWNGFALYGEWTADGAAIRPSVELPGTARGVLPLGEHALLVREIDGVRVYTLVKPGGDLDADGTGDAADAFPLDPAETSDRDGDGFGDNVDSFPDDPGESADSDGDGLGDAADLLPDFAAARVAAVEGDDWIGIVGLGRSARRIRGQLHLLDNGAFAFCNAPNSCLFGAWREKVSGKRVAMRVAPEALVSFEDAVEADLANGLDRKVKFRFLAESARGAARTETDGTVKVTFRVPHRVVIAGAGTFEGAYRVRTAGTWLEMGGASVRPLPRSAASRPRDASASPGPWPYRRRP